MNEWRKDFIEGEGRSWQKPYREINEWDGVNFAEAASRDGEI
jgi:hypothetical protein